MPLSPSGALSKKVVAPGLAGTVAPTGEEAREFGIVRLGLLAPSGQLAADFPIPDPLPAGEIAPSGTLSKVVRRNADRPYDEGLYDEGVYDDFAPAANELNEVVPSGTFRRSGTIRIWLAGTVTPAGNPWLAVADTTASLVDNFDSTLNPLFTTGGAGTHSETVSGGVLNLSTTGSAVSLVATLAGTPNHFNLVGSQVTFKLALSGAQTGYDDAEWRFITPYQGSSYRELWVGYSDGEQDAYWWDGSAWLTLFHETFTGTYRWYKISEAGGTVTIALSPSGLAGSWVTKATIPDVNWVGAGRQEFRHETEAPGSVTQFDSLNWPSTGGVGQVAPSGAISWKLTRDFVGDITPVGELVDNPDLPFLGQVTPSGTLATRVLNELRPFGTLTLVRSQSLAKAGNVTPAGAVDPALSTAAVPLALGNATEYGAYDYGSSTYGLQLDPSGLLTTQVFRGLTTATTSGQVAPSGVLTFTFRIPTFAGTVAPAGALGTSGRPITSGVVTPTGRIAAFKTRKTPAGTVTPTGGMLRIQRLNLAGTVTPTGSLPSLGSKLPRSFAGSVQPTGTISLFLNTGAMRPFGLITPTGTVTLELSGRLLAGTIVPTGRICFYYLLPPLEASLLTLTPLPVGASVLTDPETPPETILVGSDPACH